MGQGCQSRARSAVAVAIEGLHKAAMSIFGTGGSKSAKVSFAQLPQRALEIHRTRPDIRQTFDLATSKGCSGLYWWYFMHGFREMWLDFEDPEDLKGPANLRVEHLPGRSPIPVTWLMRELWLSGAVPGSLRARSKRLGRLRGAFYRSYLPAREPVTAKEQWHLIRWYFCCGLGEYNLLGLLNRDQAIELLESAGERNAIPLILRWTHQFATDLHDRYPDAADDGWSQWCAKFGQHRFPILAHPLIRDCLFPRARAAAPVSKLFDGTPFGVNLIGHVGTRSGVGEDLRMAERALEAAEIPFVVRNAPPSTGVLPEETHCELHIADHSPFGINVFCMAGMETVTMLSARRNLLEGKFNVGFWPWELPEWPTLWHHAPRLMDELWASTRFTVDAYRRSTSVPVRHVPMAVQVNETQGLTRSDFALSEGRFMFGYSFDGHSSFDRKNPEGAIKAFLLAFPRGNEPTGLVLKGLRVNDHPKWSMLESLAARDPRITLIPASMPRGALLDLYRAIDCFVSLHRSEGFGRNIAECMLLGKPVIATNYSGNADFTLDSTAALVSVKLTPVGDGEYPFGAGQLWADPSVEEAAQLMRRMLVDRAWRVRLGRAGQAFIERHHSPLAVGLEFGRELKRIANSLRGTK